LFQYQLLDPDGSPVDPPTLASAVPDWRVGDRVIVKPGVLEFSVVGMAVPDRDEFYGALIVERVE
jgi:hypothetical protein